MLKFNAEKHEYTLNGHPLISVTTLLGKHGLSVDYSAVPIKTLSDKANFGNQVHKSIEHYLKGYSVDFRYKDYVQSFKDLMDKNNFMVTLSEKKVHNDIVAGTVDLVANKDGKNVLLDIKTTYKLHKDVVAWQLSLYKDLLKTTFDIDIEKLYCVWLNKGNFELVEIDEIPKENIERLYACERLGLLYGDLGIVDVKSQEQALMVVKEIDKLKKEIERLELIKQSVDEQIKQEMLKNGVKSFDNDFIKITYVAPQERVSIDYKKLVEEKGIEFTMEEIQNATKRTYVKDSVRIKIKGE